MLQFLPLAISGMQLLGSLANTANTARGYQPTAAEKAQEQAMANQQALLKAYLDPNSTIFKNVNAAENQQLQNATQAAISNFLAANRKNQLMDRTSYLNPERQDETINRLVMNATDVNANTARSNALQRIIDAANGYKSSAAGYGTMVQTQQAAQNTNRTALPTALGQGVDILKSFQPGGSMSNIYSMLGGGGGFMPGYAAIPNGQMA